MARPLRKRGRGVAAEEEFPRRVEDLGIHLILSADVSSASIQRVPRSRG
jgi:hypothetical protein